MCSVLGTIRGEREVTILGVFVPDFFLYLVGFLVGWAAVMVMLERRRLK